VEKLIATMHFGRGTVTHFSRGCIPKMVLLQLLKRWEFCVMRASKGKARYERSAKKKKKKERAAVASAVTAVTAVILVYAGNKCAPLTHTSAIALTI